MKKLSMLIALMCIMIIPVTQLQSQEVTADSITGIWQVDNTDDLIKVYKVGDTYTGVLLGPTESKAHPDSRKYESTKEGIILFEGAEFKNGIWTGSTRFYDYTTDKKHRYEIEIVESGVPKKAKLTLKRFLAQNKTTHWTKRSSNSGSD